MRLALACACALLAGCGARTALDGASDAGPRCEPGPEVCNGADDDCDGATDEDVPPMACGDACDTYVECEGGTFPPCASPDPSPETCNAIDDDCDGAIDEELALGPLGDVIVVRADEGHTTECTSCYWAFDSGLAPIDTGYLAYWRVGLYGGDERPSFFGRRLAGDGTPLGEVETLTGDFVLSLASLHAPLDGRTGIGTCFRVGSRDVAGWQLVSRDGRIDAVQGTFSECPSAMFSAGGRVVGVWLRDYEIHVDTAEPDGSEEIETVIDPSARVVGAWSGAFEDRVGVLYLVVEDDRRELFFLATDSRGETLLGPTLVPIEYDSYPRVIGTREGWLVIFPGDARRMRPATRALLDPSGNLIGEPRPFADARTFADTDLSSAFVHHPSQPIIAAAWQASSSEPGDLHVELLDETGEPIRSWSGSTPGSGWVGSPDVVFASDGRLLVTWHDTAEDSTPNRVYVRELGCVD